MSKTQVEFSRVCPSVDFTAHTRSGTLHLSSRCNSSFALTRCTCLRTMSNKRHSNSDVGGASDSKRQAVESKMFRSSNILPEEELRSESESDTDSGTVPPVDANMVAPSELKPALSQRALAAREKRVHIPAKPIFVSMFNQKGGVGKTTATYEIGFTLSRMGLRVLMADLDPQCSLSSLVQPKHASDIAAADEFRKRLAAGASSMTSSHLHSTMRCKSMYRRSPSSCTLCRCISTRTSSICQVHCESVSLLRWSLRR